MRIPPRLNKALDWVSARRTSPAMILVPPIVVLFLATAIAKSWWLAITAIVASFVAFLLGRASKGGAR